MDRDEFLYPFAFISIWVNVQTVRTKIILDYLWGRKGHVRDLSIVRILDPWWFILITISLLDNGPILVGADVGNFSDA
jgi:hypothetical protein